MFPEGTRNLGKNKLLPFKKGAFHLALASEVPIQLVAVSRYTFLKSLRFESGKFILMREVGFTGQYFFSVFLAFVDIMSFKSLY